MSNRTKERAWEIIEIYLKSIENVKSVKSVILVGSLSDDTYPDRITGIKENQSTFQTEKCSLFFLF